MENINGLLGVLAQQKAQELRFETNQPARLVLASGEARVVTHTALTGGQIGTMVLPLLPDVARRQLPTQPEVYFDYNSPTVGQFKGLLRKQPEGIAVLFRLAGTPGEFSRTGTPAPQPAPATHTPPPASYAPPPPQPVPQPVLSAASVTENLPLRHIDELFRWMSEVGASDLHLSVSMPPLVRKDGSIQPLNPSYAALTPEKIRELLWPIIPEINRAEFEKRHDTDFAYEVAQLARFRANIFMDRKGMGAVFRIIPSKILTAEQLNLSDAILNLCKLSKGLVVVTGPTGSGKSTTLCAMVDYINRTRDDHIITIEDPIEFVHDNKNCLINQREVHNHTDSFKNALRAALREDPDILLVGEMRDLETIAIAIETAETGHLVFGTLHTTTAASTIDRIIDQFPSDRQAQVRTMLSESLRGVIAQTLLKKKGGGRVAALEILIITPAISNLIREGKTFQIPSAMQTGRGLGMVTLNDALIDLVKKGIVDMEEAYIKAVDKTGFEALLKRENVRATQQ